jgi:hypothetical protein
MTDVGARAPEVYRLSMEKLPFAQARARRIAVVEVLAGTTALVALLELVGRGAAVATDAALVVWGLAAALLPYFMWSAAKRVRRRANAFELSIGGETLRCAARGAGRVVIRLEDIATITEGMEGLVVRSSAPGVVVRIPRVVEGFVDVRTRLGKHRPIEGTSDALAWPAAAVGTGLLAAATAFLWGRSGCVAAGVLLFQAAAVFAIASEIRWHPRLARGAKLTTFAVLAASVAAPVVAFAYVLASALVD